MKKTAWQDRVSTALGALLAFSPAVFGYSDLSEATSNSIVAGALLVATGLRAMWWPRGWEEALASAAGLWLGVSPWVLGFDTNLTATAIAFGAGLLALALAQRTLWGRFILATWQRSAITTGIDAHQSEVSDEKPPGATPTSTTRSLPASVRVFPGPAETNSLSTASEKTLEPTAPSESRPAAASAGAERVSA